MPELNEATCSPDAKRVILEIIDLHTIKRPITSEELTQEVNRRGIAISNRRVRYGVRALKREKHMIGAIAGRGGGYYRANSFEDYQRSRREHIRKLTDIAKTIRTQDAAAEKAFGPQLYLPRQVTSAIEVLINSLGEPPAN